MKKQLILSTIISASLAFSASSFADTPSDKQKPSPDPSSSLNAFADKISDSINDAIKPLTTAVNLIYSTYTTDSNQPNTMQKPARMNNQQILSSQNASNKSSEAASLNFVASQLNQFPSNFHAKDPNYTPPATNKSSNSDGSYVFNDFETPASLSESLDKLTASDDIQLSDNANNAISIFGSKDNKTAKNNNESMSFGGLINPSQYETKSNIQAAQNFIAFDSQSYKNLADSIDLEKLGKLESNGKDGKDAVQAIFSSDNFKDYKRDYRSIISQQSVGYNNLSYLAAQRAGSPSVLASEEAKIHARIGTLNWYSNVQAASSATVQRRTLIVLAEIENEMHQNQLINQRMLATLSTMELQNTQTAKMQLAASAGKLNREISNCSENPSANCAAVTPALPTAPVGKNK